MNQNGNRAASILQQAINRHGQGDRDFQAMQALDQYAEQEEYKKQMAAQQEAAYYENLNKQAENLLGYDRERVQEHARQLQKNIHEKVRMYGGDRKRFMENGGHRIMQTYTGDIVNSREFTIYRQNKENMVKIMDAKEKGLGHLLSPDDLRSMEEYKANKGGEIKYSGLLNEIEQPPAANYNLGEFIPPSDVLNHGDNMVKITANFKQMHPDLEVTIPNLMAFGHKMGYFGNKGSHRAPKGSGTRGSGNGKGQQDKREINLITGTKNALLAMPKGMTVEDLYDAENGYAPKNFYDERKKEDPSVGLYMSDTPWEYMGNNSNLNEQGLLPDMHYAWGGDALRWLLTDKYKVANANRVFEGYESTITEAILNKKVEGGRLKNFKLDESWHRTDGSQLINDRALEWEKHQGDMEVLGLTTANLVDIRDEDGNPDGKKILMSVHDDDGALDEKRTKNFAHSLIESGNPEVSPSIVLAVRDKDNNIFYRPIDMNNMSTIGRIREAGGDGMILNDIAESEQRMTEEQQTAAKQIEQDQEKYEQTMLTIDKKMDENPSFQQESSMYTSTQDPSDNRSNMMKTFYLAQANGGDPSGVVGQQVFTQAIEMAGPRFKEEMLKYNTYNDEQLIDLWVNHMNRDLHNNPSGQANNRAFAARWKKLYQMHRQNFKTQ